ncbi:hypothetical protein NDU88_000742 [Pleurodeles waltl]|uniref:Uncharacterized protein n=1 Tax=Pleurodeles waltl TaxID=8319 RepID=A0AAV7N8X1_PLEWA|nr:hypothetical protein NDU88_000742 [Pleurodeles waltl]
MEEMAQCMASAVAKDLCHTVMVNKGSTLRSWHSAWHLFHRICVHTMIVTEEQGYYMEELARCMASAVAKDLCACCDGEDQGYYMEELARCMASAVADYLCAYCDGKQGYYMEGLARCMASALS